MTEATANVGVFYWTPERLYSDMIPLAEADAGSISIEHGGHPSLWKTIDATTRLNVGDSYSAIPRGRVVYHRASSRYWLYADHCIPAHAVKSIARHFELPEDGYDLRRDPHYKCRHCQKNFVSDDVGLNDDFEEPYQF